MNVFLIQYIGTIDLPRLARALLTLIGSCRISYVFKIRARLPFNILFLKVQFAVEKVLLTNIFFKHRSKNVSGIKRYTCVDDRRSGKV